MKIYLAGPISGLEPKVCRKLFNDAEKRLKKNKHTVINPWKLDQKMGDLPTWADYLKRDIPLLIKCDGILLLEGWEFSKGANLEAYIADQLGIGRVDSNGDPLVREI